MRANSALSISQFDEDVISVAFQLQSLKESGDWGRWNQIVLHVRKSDGRLNSLDAVVKGERETKEVPKLREVK